MNLITAIKQVNLKKVAPLAFSALTAIVSMTTTFFVAGYIGESAYGELQYYVSLATIVSMICGLGMNTFLVKNEQFNMNRPIFTKALIYICGFAIVFFPLFFSFCYWGFQELNAQSDVIIVIYLTGLMISIVTLIGSHYIGIGRSSLSVFFTNFSPKLLIFIVSLFLIFLLSSLENFSHIYIYLYMFTYLVCAIPFLFILVKKTNFTWQKNEIISLLVFYLITITYSINTYLARIFEVEIFDNFSSTGILSVGLQLAAIATLFVDTITSITRPIFSKLKNDKVELALHFRKIVRISAYIVIPFSVAYIIQAEKLLTLVGTQYAIGVPILIILTINVLVSCLTGPLGTMLTMAGYEKFELVNGFINIAVFVLLTFLLIPFNELCIPLAILLTTTITNIIKIVQVNIAIQQKVYFFVDLLQFLVIAVISCACFFGINMISNVYIWVSVNVIVGGCLIVCSFLINPHKEDKYFLFMKSNIHHN